MCLIYLRHFITKGFYEREVNQQITAENGNMGLCSNRTPVDWWWMFRL